MSFDPNEFPETEALIEISPIRPIIDPLLSLFRSRKFLTAILTLAVNLALLAVPSLAPLRTEILTIVSALGLAVIGGIAYEDAAKGGREIAAAPIVANEDLVREIVLDTINVYLNRSEKAN